MTPTTPASASVQSERTHYLLSQLAAIAEGSHAWDFVAPLVVEARALLSQPAASQEAQRVYLVATGEIHEGEETYTRHDVCPPLCDAETLYTHPQQPSATGGDGRKTLAEAGFARRPSTFIAGSLRADMCEDAPTSQPTSGAADWRDACQAAVSHLDFDNGVPTSVADALRTLSEALHSPDADPNTLKVRPHHDWLLINGARISVAALATPPAQKADKAAAQQGVAAEGLLAQHARDSAELRNLCQARDDARRERDAARAEIAGLESAVGHLSVMVDGKTRLVQKAVAIMKALHGSAAPDDGPEMNAIIPAHAFRVFVDGHAELMHALAVGPQITTPQPSQQARQPMTDGGEA